MCGSERLLRRCSSIDYSAGDNFSEGEFRSKNSETLFFVCTA